MFVIYHFCVRWTDSGRTGNRIYLKKLDVIRSRIPVALRPTLSLSAALAVAWFIGGAFAPGKSAAKDGVSSFASTGFGGSVSVGGSTLDAANGQALIGSGASRNSRFSFGEAYVRRRPPSVLAALPLGTEFSEVDHSSGPIGAPFAISGAGFGVYSASNTRVSFNGLPAQISWWDDGLIQGTVPGRSSTGTARLVISRDNGKGLIESRILPFQVVLPVIATMTTTPGLADVAVTISGTGFGSYAGDATRLLVGGSTVSLAVWIDTEIVWNVPMTLPDGVYPVSIVLNPPDGGSFQTERAEFRIGRSRNAGVFRERSAEPLGSRPEAQFHGDMNLSPRGGRIQTPSGAAVEVPAHALSRNTEITLSRVADAFKVERTKAMKRARLGAAGELIAFGPEETQLSRSITIELPYDPALVAPEQVSDLAIYRYDPVLKTWTPLHSQLDSVRHVLAAQTDRLSLYQPLGSGIGVAALDASFGLKAVYAFPNPARGTNLVTIRVQPGLADSVEVRIYDLSGRKIHSSSEFVQSQLDDGNGLGIQYTYDHVWKISGVGSGIYTYAVTARRAGQPDLHRTGKVGLVK